MGLEAWLERHRDQLGSPYETLFVESVLSRVPELDLLTLYVQYHFVDADGGNRYCDFAILEGNDLRIAIEVDGYDKRGRGQGMTRDEFVDWQRRHASLVTQGWSVLRFANVDVRDYAARCAEHVCLLLRQERSKLSHRKQLEEKIQAIEGELAKSRLRVAEEPARYGLPTSESGGRSSSEELAELRRLLKSAKVASELSGRERIRLKQLEDAQRDIVFLTKETSTMKTTIWAMTALMAFVIALLFFNQYRPTQSSMTGQAITPTAAAPPLASETLGISAVNSTHSATAQIAEVSLAGTSCDQPIAWQEARERIGTTVAVTGPVARIAERKEIKGQPTFITIGRAFPSRDRLDAVIWGNRREQFAEVLDQNIQGRDACLFGELTERDGLPQMVLRDEDQLRLK